MFKSQSSTWTKVIIRKLPPYLKEEAFKKVLNEKWTNKYNWISFYQGKINALRTVYSRAYINFNDPKDVLVFKKDFDGHVFIGSRGTQFKCIVQYAPYQKVPKKKTKKDAREGTINKDPDYIKFVKEMEKGPEALPSAQRQYEKEIMLKKERGEDEEKKVITPLMKCVMDKHSGGGRSSRSLSSNRNRSSVLSHNRKVSEKVKRIIIRGGDSATKSSGSGNNSSKSLNDVELKKSFKKEEIKEDKTTNEKENETKGTIGEVGGLQVKDDNDKEEVNTKEIYNTKVDESVMKSKKNHVNEAVVNTKEESESNSEENWRNGKNYSGYKTIVTRGNSGNSGNSGNGNVGSSSNSSSSRRGRGSRISSSMWILKKDK